MPDSTHAHDELDALLEPAPPRRRRLLLAALLGIGAILALVVLRADGDRSEPRFRTEPIVRTDLAAIVSATGNLEPTNQVDVGSELSGTIDEVLVESNDTVVAGQILARLDTSKLEQQTERTRAALLSAEAQLAQAEATQVEATTELARFEEVARLSDGKVPSKTELDAARAATLRADAAVESARAAVAEARAALRTNERDLGKLVIRSPIDGVVLDRNVEPGQTVAASFQAPVLFTIAQDLKRMDLTVNVSEADVGSVQVGQHATFTVDAWPDKQFDAVVKKVSFGSTTVENVVSYETELEVPNDDLSLRPGMTATADIRVAERQAVLVVSNAALRFSPPAARTPRSGFSLLPRPPEASPNGGSGTGPRVYVLRDGRPARIAVTTGLTDGRQTEVESPDLAAGDEVVVESLGAAS